jgi:ubiquinone/menaquinone biosynthesis C-methylase UbiE
MVLKGRSEVATVAHEKFDVSKMERLEDRARFADLDRGVMWDAIGLPAPAVIVDVGAGTGLFARTFALLAPQAVVYAVDTEPAMLRWISDHSDPESAGRIVPLLAEETRIPLQDDVADVAIMIDLHHELAEPLASYAEVLRLLRPGGRLLVADWAPTAEGDGPPRQIRVTAGQISDALRTAGFGDIQSHRGLPRHTLVTATKNV